MANKLKKVLTIAGSDSGGGAGIQADLKTFTSLSVYGTSAITAVTAQNTLGVSGIHIIPASFVRQQLESVLSDIGSDAIKIGMLANAEIIHEVGSFLKNVYPSKCKSLFKLNLVVDPVMISTSGSELLDPFAIKALIQDIFPFALVLTPNIPEAEKLLEEYNRMNPGQNFATKLESLNDMKEGAKALAELGPEFVLVKGGHAPVFHSSQTQSFLYSQSESEKLEVVDILYDSKNQKYYEIRKPYVKTKNTHGSGCTLSAALASYLAKGFDVVDACKKASQYVSNAFEVSSSIGQGNGPLNHFHGILQRQVPFPSPTNPHPFVSLLIDSCESTWKLYTEHLFVQRIANGTLPRDIFVHYLIQDYLFLQNFARVHGLGAYKAKLLSDSARFAESVVSIARESQLHIKLCAKWGVTLEEIQATPESMATIAYTRYIIDTGLSGDILDMTVGIAACTIGYGVIGLKLLNDTNTLKGESNPYWEWILDYSGENYQKGVKESIDRLETMAMKLQPSEYRMGQLKNIFQEATKLEIAFWEMAYNKE